MVTIKADEEVVGKTFTEPNMTKLAVDYAE